MFKYAYFPTKWQAKKLELQLYFSSELSLYLAILTLSQMLVYFTIILQSSCLRIASLYITILREKKVRISEINSHNYLFFIQYNIKL